jgi:DNA-directed RNA polymerase subunit M/transcription elongation factor TFIIS
MRFCAVCRNMMLLATDAAGTGAAYRCPNCAHEEVVDPGAPHVVRAAAPVASDRAGMSYRRFLTPGLAKDPTLPRPPGAVCPLCEEVGQVTFVKYAPVRYVYACGACSRFWKGARSVEEVGQDGR